MQPSRSLSEIFALAGGHATDGEDLERALRERLHAARVAWPSVEIDDDSFVRHIAKHSLGGALPPAVNAGDLYLACACANGVVEALSEFERTFSAAMRRAVARIDSSVADDTMQAIREALFVREKDSDLLPKIADYGGRAPLRTWLAAIAARRALNARRRIGDRPHESLSGVATRAATASPDLELLRAGFARDFEAAVHVAVSRLDSRARALLRLHLCEGLSIDRIAPMYGVGRSTAARWLSAARETIRIETRAELRSRLGLASEELESLIGAVGSALDVSVARLLSSNKD